MNKLETSLILVAAAMMGYVGMPLAADEISDADDLTAVIALQGKPCGRVVSAAKRGENDFVATCEDGNRYRVYVRDGRVVVEKTG